MLLNRHMLCLINVFALYMSDYLSVPNNLSKKYDKNEFLKKLVGIRYLTNVPAKADC